MNEFGSQIRQAVYERGDQRDVEAGSVSRGEGLRGGKSMAALLYAVLTGFLLLEFIWEILVYRRAYTAPAWVLLLRLGSAGLGIWLGKLWKDWGFRLLAALWILLFIRVFFTDQARLFDNGVSQKLMAGLWAWGGCYALGRVLEEKQLRRFALILAALWTVWMLANCGLGLYATVTRVKIPNLSGKGYWRALGKIGAARLHLVYGATTTGAVLAFSAMIAGIALFAVRPVWAKILFGLSLLPLLLCLCLTDARSAMFMTAAGIAALTGIRVYRHLVGEDVSTEARTPVLAAAAALLAAAAVFGVCVILLLQVTPLFNRLQVRGLIPRALAEAEATTVPNGMASRGLEEAYELSGRTGIWRATLRYIGKKPMTLLTGTSIDQTMSGVNALRKNASSAAHCHNLPLQVLLEAGIPGLLLFCAFAGLIFTRAFRVVRDPGQPLWIRLLPAMLIGMAVGEMVECYTALLTYATPVTFFLFAVLGVISARGERKPLSGSETGSLRYAGDER